jgi:uncharacterized protein YecE (DUF72 family)
MASRQLRWNWRLLETVLLASVSEGFMQSSATIRIGISGWRYEPWRGAFYPKGLPQRLELWYASRILPTIEINGSFYSLQRPDYYREWHDQTPDDFVFSVKGPRFITHMKKLNDVETPLANFFASGVFQLHAKLGPILWQFPPNFAFNAEKLTRFFELLPRDTKAALRLARKHDHRLKGRADLAIDRNRPLRYAMEIRHPSFVDPAFVSLLRKHDIALVIAETAKRWPMLHDITADFLYMRLHGDKELYKSGYSDKSLERWAERMRHWNRGDQPSDAQTVAPARGRSRKTRDIYCYFDNTDIKLRAPIDAQSLLRKLGIKPGDPPQWRPSKPATSLGQKSMLVPRRAHAPSLRL